MIRMAFAHELAHQFDYAELDDRERLGLIRRMGLEGEWRQAQSFSPHEVFAETYAMCMIRGGQALPVGPRRFRQVCRFASASY